MNNHKFALAITYYDPAGRLFDAFRSAFSVWNDLFAGIVVNASDRSSANTLNWLRSAGAVVHQRPDVTDAAHPAIGLYRRTAVSQALQLHPSHLLLADGDRAAFWANHYPEEMAAVVKLLPKADFTVIGRTPRALATHPRAMIETESLVNEMFGRVFGRTWDALAATRGLSKRAAEFLVEHSTDDSVGVDVSWPLLVQQAGGFRLAYREVGGMAFETAVEFADEVAAAGGEAAWKAQIDNDPQQWKFRLRAAQVEINAIRPFVDPPAA